PLALARIEPHAPTGLRIDAHLAYLASERRLHLGGGEVLVELARAEQRERIRTRHLGHGHAEAALHELGTHLVPHRLRVAQELRTLVAQPRQRDAVQQLPRRDVAVGQAERLRDVALALEPLALHRRQLLLHERAARLLDRRALALVRAVGQLDRRALVGDLSPVLHLHDRVPLPGDLALVQRRQLARALRLRLPVEQQPRRAPLLASLGGGEEVLAR